MTTETKPKCKLTGIDGNIFNLMGKASKALKQAGQSEKATEMCELITVAGSYHEALALIGTYVEIS